jgi:hypothetical protein
LNVGTAPVGCTTYPVLNVWDNTAGSSIASVTLASGTNAYPMTVNISSIASTHVIADRVSTAAVGCTTNTANAIFNVLYH